MQLPSINIFYMYVFLQIANSVKSGADADAIYKPTVYWYTSLKFLDASTTADKSESNLEVSNQEDDQNAPTEVSHALTVLVLPWNFTNSIVKCFKCFSHFATVTMTIIYLP